MDPTQDPGSGADRQDAMPPPPPPTPASTTSASPTPSAPLPPWATVPLPPPPQWSPRVLPAAPSTIPAVGATPAHPMPEPAPQPEPTSPADPNLRTDEPPKPWYRRPVAWLGGAVGLAVVVAAVVVLMLYRPAIDAHAIAGPDAVVAGDDATIRVMVGNTGWGSGQRELTVLLDAEPASTETFTVPGRSETWVDVVLPDVEAGRYTVSLAGVEGVSAPLWVMTPPEFVIDAVHVTPNPMDIATSPAATATVEVSNIGEADGAHELELTIDGVPVQTRTVSLAGGATGSEQFDLTVDGPGIHEVRVDEARTVLEVHQIERPEHGAVLVNSIGGGSNELRVANNGPDDLLVVLAAPGENPSALLSVYLHGNSSHTVTGITDGVYSTYYAFGTDWCAFDTRFTVRATQGRFEQDSTYESGPAFFTYYTLEMGSATGPTVPTQYVQPGGFPTM